MRQHANEPTGGGSVLGVLWEEFGRTQPASDAVYVTLREAIVSGRLQPGERLGEEHLARSFGVSRTPVREAIRRLESENLASREGRRGAVVGGIGAYEVQDVYAVRAALDGLAARLAAARAYPADHARLRWLNDRLAEAAARHDVEVIAELSVQFHDALCEAAHNAMLLRFARQIHDSIRRFRDAPLSFDGRAEEAVAEHRRVLEAIEGGDAELAEELARKHMNQAGAFRRAVE